MFVHFFTRWSGPTVLVLGGGAVVVLNYLDDAFSAIKICITSEGRKNLPAPEDIAVPHRRIDRGFRATGSHNGAIGGPGGTRTHGQGIMSPLL